MKNIQNLEITDIADEGRAVGRYNDMVVFVENAVPGDIVDVQIFKKKKNFAEAFIINLVKPSAHRFDPFCSHFGVCGGCKWQYLNYEQQLYFKQQQVAQAMKRLAHVNDVPTQSIIASDNVRYYRNKLEFTFSNKKWLTNDERNAGVSDVDKVLGFHIKGRFDKILNIDTCYLQNDLSNKIRNFICEFCIENNFSFFDLRQQEGMMRNLIIRNTAAGQWMVLVVFSQDDEGSRNKLLQAIMHEFNQINCLMYSINQKKNDSIYDLEFTLFSGLPYIIETMGDLSYRMGPKSFFQTNSHQALKLYQVAQKYAQLTGAETVYDLYTGTGTIANFIAGKALKVIGIEYVASAIDDARINSEINSIKNTSFYAGDMKDMLTESFFETHGKPDVIITDPPRAGMHAQVVEMLHKSGAQRIVYVSCNVATQARDIALLTQKYQVSAIQPVDMFPHTHHVENVVLLSLK